MQTLVFIQWSEPTSTLMILYFFYIFPDFYFEFQEVESWGVDTLPSCLDQICNVEVVKVFIRKRKLISNKSTDERPSELGLDTE